MKKILLTMITMILLLSACGKGSIYTVTYGEEEFIVDTVNHTISHYDEVYKYQVSGSRYEITYPDNSTYWWSQQGNFGSGGFSDDYNEAKYVSGDVLVDVLSSKYESSNTQKSFLLIIILLIIGIWHVVSPYSTWYLNYGWRYKNAEPSDTALFLARFSGIVTIIIALILLFI